MLKTIILITVCVLMGFFSVCTFIMAQAEKKERYKIQKQLDEVFEHEEHAAEIISNANKTKSDARTGKHSTDINFMADKLHDYAKK